jgi:dihydrofolate reductase
MDYCRYAYVTKIYTSEDSDTFFPNLDTLPNWTLETPGDKLTSGSIEYAFLRYENLSPLEYTKN